MKRGLIDRSEDVKNLPEHYTRNVSVRLLQSNLLFKDSKLAKTSSSEEFVDNENDSDNLKASSNCNYIPTYF